MRTNAGGRMIKGLDKSVSQLAHYGSEAPESIRLSPNYSTYTFLPAFPIYRVNFKIVCVSKQNRHLGFEQKNKKRILALLAQLTTTNLTK